VLGGATGAHYIHDYQEVGGLMVPYRRRVYPRGADNRLVPEPVLVSTTSVTSCSDLDRTRVD